RAPERLRGQLHDLGEAAVLADADDLVVRANVRVADAALVAGAADDVALGRHDVADLEPERALRVAAQLDDAPEELVADDPRALVVAIERLEDHVLERGAEPDPPVGAAEAGHDRLDE